MSDGLRCMYRQRSRQQKRERGIVQPAERVMPQYPSDVSCSFENQPLFFSSNEDWEQTSPQGPPSDLL